VILDPQPWLDARGARAIGDALGAGTGETRAVGGAVRDTLLGIEVADVDFATRLAPAAVIARLEAAGLKAVPTGIDHGTITAVAHGAKIEVTTLRRDVATDGRHAVVAFTDDWREDAARRDFTINALYADLSTREVHDYFGGLADLAERRVRFIGDPLRRIAEDHLRILRFFRFHARFGRGAPDAEGLDACAARANDLMALSRERIRDELLKMLVIADPLPTLAVMLERGILAPVLPEIDPARLPELARVIAVEQGTGTLPIALRRLAALLPSDERLLDELGARLRLSNAERKRLVATADRLPSIPGSALPLAYRSGGDGAVDRLILAADEAAQVAPLVAQVEGWTRPPLPLSGKDLIALGVPQGPAVSTAMRTFEDAWIAAGFPADREEALALARQAVAALATR
jgi:poly(A) polymerase